MRVLVAAVTKEIVSPLDKEREKREKQLGIKVMRWEESGGGGATS
jgi:hypothetical protein